MSRITSGLLLIIIGIFFLLDTFDVINNFWVTLWPLTLVIVGLGFHIGFFAGGAKRSSAGVLVPGGILLVIGSVMLFHTTFGWGYAVNTWPIYLLAVALGLFELWLFGGRENGLLIPVSILSFLGIFFFIDNLLPISIFEFWPVVLIIIGLGMLFSTKKNKNMDV
ncbi:LiaI-LiaF-like domain-containing protein [Cytobacillus sp. IB215316]|uniref:LiaI-LiaF-like domain-containing protein n=1 Tax=Cytobacillus sp. IB215316 TaxID=3097354 RepID=UPI002A10EB8E|nr:DUF5668 domain-containing protein [Cytobacillus sp. IB215316]MDX8360399.1 DUF5668 domain-containing protein [Cytobacillus sp. IB215316]